MIKLLCTQGMTKGDEYQIADGDMLMGRSESSDVLILDNSSSRHHATLSTKNGITTLIDAKSKNGLLVNEKKLDQKMILKPSDIIKVGYTIFEVVSSVESDASKDLSFSLPKPRSGIVPPVPSTTIKGH